MNTCTSKMDSIFMTSLVLLALAFVEVILTFDHELAQIPT